MPPIRFGIDVGTTLQERDGRVDVSLALPPEGVGVALALTLTSAVEEEDSVPVAREQLRPLLRRRPARERDHRRTVPRGDVPPLQPQPVARRERHVLVGRAQIWGRNLCARRVRDDVGDGDRHDDGEDREQRRRNEDQPARVPPPEAVVRPPRSPQSHGAEADQHEAGGDREETGVVVAGRPYRPRVVNGFRSGEDAEEPCDERDRRACPGTETWVEDAGDDEKCQWHEAADEVIGGGGPGVWLQEVVVDDVEGDDAERDSGEAGFGAKGCRDTGRGSPS